MLVQRGLFSSVGVAISLPMCGICGRIQVGEKHLKSMFDGKMNEDKEIQR